MSSRLHALAAVLLLTQAACSHFTHSAKPTADKGPRQQLAIGYSQLYQEAAGIPKLKWLIRFKEKPQEMSEVSAGLVSYYQQLAATMEKLSKQYPAMRIDVQPMSEIEADERKAIGADLAKDLAPVIGKSGTAFEREALLTFYDSLNEQRHLVRVMLERETVPALKDFLETTRYQLDEQHGKVGAHLERRYFVH
jgi:hypothetical protein